MSRSHNPHINQSDDDRDPWAELAEHEDTLEMLVDEETALADTAEELLDGLDEEGYR